jgi:hypothetical protein
MKVMLIILISLLVILFCVRTITKRKMPAGIESIDRGQYELLLGTDARQVFLYYRVSSMHGLSLEGAEKRIAQGGTYIDGLCNYHPRDKNLNMDPLPFLFLNIGSLQNNYSNHQKYLVVMHECMHMAGRLYDDCWDSHEEEMITWAEAEANKIIVLLKKKKFI